MKTIIFISLFFISFQTQAQFDELGRLLTSLSKGHDHGEVVAIQSDGKIVVAGVVDYGKSADVGVVRYLKNGRLDKSFGNEGKMIIDGGGREEVYGLGIQNNGKIIIAGATKQKGKKDFMLLQLNPNGSLDRQFGNQGKVITDLGGSDEIHYLVLAPNGKIIVAGYSKIKKKVGAVVARFHPDGSLDKSFSEQGWIRLQMTKQDRFFGVALHPNGEIVATGSLSLSDDVSQEDCVVVRLSPQGKVIKTMTVSFGNKQEVCSSVVVLPNHLIAIAGFSFQNITKGDFSLDLGNFRATLDFENENDVAHAIGFYGNHLYLGGEYGKKEGSGFALARFDLNGKLDTTFANHGMMKIDFGTHQKEIANAMVISSNGVVYLAGFAGKDFALVRVDVSH